MPGPPVSRRRLRRRRLPLPPVRRHPNRPLPPEKPGPCVFIPVSNHTLPSPSPPSHSPHHLGHCRRRRLPPLANLSWSPLKHFFFPKKSASPSARMADDALESSPQLF